MIVFHALHYKIFKSKITKKCYALLQLKLTLKVWRKDQFEVSNPYFELDLFCYLVVDLFITCQPLSSNLLNTLEYSLGNF